MAAHFKRRVAPSAADDIGISRFLKSHVTVADLDKSEAADFMGLDFTLRTDA